MTIKDIATELGVSTAMVSLCLNGHDADPRYCIRPEKAKRIRAYAKSCGYVRDAAASRMRSTKVLPPVGIIFNEMHGFERKMQAFHDIIGILDAAGRSYQVLSYKPNRMASALELLRGQRVRTVICMSLLAEPCPVQRPFDLSHMNKEQQLQKKEFLEDWRQVDQQLKHLTLYSLYYMFPKPVDGGIQHGLIRMGGDVSQLVENTLRKIKAAGLDPAVVAQWHGQEKKRLVPGLLESPDYVFYAPEIKNRWEAGRILGKELLQFRKKHYFRTVFYGNDAVAGGIMATFTEVGLRIPEDVAILGFGDDDAANCMRVPLSTFDSGIVANAHLAAKAIVENRSLPQDNLIEFNYIQRESMQLE